MRHGTIAALLGLLLGGCAYHPEAEPPTVDLPATLALADPAASAAWPDEAWWHGFGSGELDGLVADAGARNEDLAAAVARVHQAQALARVAAAPLLPAVGVGADVSHQSYNDSTGVVSGTYGDATLTASYELDFWGRNSAAAAAARAALQASRYDRQTVTLTLTAGVADAYFQALSARERLVIGRSNLGAAHAILTLVEARARDGTALAREVAQQRALVATEDAAIPPLEQAEIEALATLALLLGRPPQGFTVAGKGLAPLMAPPVSPGLPSELLERRPDIASAEAQLAAADANVAAARAAMLPRIDLTAATGAQAALMSGGGSGFLYSLAAGLTQPIFDNGALAGQRDYAKGQQEELVARYRSAVLAAFADVQKTLQALDHLRTQQAPQETVVAESRRAFDLATTQYRAGAEDLLTVLDTQRTLYGAQDQLSQIKLARLQAVVGLYKALGGGWKQGDSQS